MLKENELIGAIGPVPLAIVGGRLHYLIEGEVFARPQVGEFAETFC